MTLTKRGKVAIGVLAAAAVVLVGIGVLAFTGAAPAPLRRLVDTVTGRPTPCPLTGETLQGDRDAPDRPAIAVKVENTDDAYPLSGLHRADIVYEEPVEGGITRFVAVFQCRQAERVGPVRSARTTDPKILVQFGGEPLLAYSGAAEAVTRAVDAAEVRSLTETTANDAFERDGSRLAPHNLYVSVPRLYRAARASGADLSMPREVFTFDADVPGGKRRSVATVTFSPATTAVWEWTGQEWARSLDGAPMLLEDEQPIAATNVVIQEVEVGTSTIVDASGSASPTVDLTGNGRAWILRDGRLIVGRWQRRSLEDVTVFESRSGERIALAPGTTFVQLIPAEGGEVSFER
ncbi:MAG TPA: DUF3048 domain-containing protein [Actinomycetota bacterium]|nr:DUF3048 domain-containing protein [Actinomycetota bacterium]